MYENCTLKDIFAEDAWNLKGICQQTSHMPIGADDTDLLTGYLAV